MKLHSDSNESGHACESVSNAAQDMNLNHRLTLTSCGLKPGSQDCGPGWLEEPEQLCNGLSDQSELENFMSHCEKSEVDPDRVTVTFEDDSRSLTSSTVDDEDNVTLEIQQAYRIFQSFLSEKHKAIAAPFWHPIGPGAHGDQAPDSDMCFRKMDDKFVNREYESITAFVADFRLMLENCYRFHGVDHWISKQAQKLEIILEQKLTLLSRTLREKTTLAVTSRGRFGTEDEKVPVGTSSRRRSVPRNLAAITVGGSESIMVQALRLEELQRAKEERRQREQERKEAEEVSAKEVEDWEHSLLSLSEPWLVRTMWELPAIGHFLCLAQTALNLPEIVFYELERCLLMPRCSSFLARVMTSLLCHPHKRANLHRRLALPYRKWEAELRRRVQGWYQAVGRVEDQVTRAEQLGLCHQFFWTLGEVNPLEETAFHQLPFNQRVWLLKGLCDHVYETQKDVQDAVLGQPIHECRESILGYDSEENIYIHFPHFCGADLRIYRQSPCLAMEFPLPVFHVKRCEQETGSAGSEVKVEMNEKGLFLSVDGVKLENDGSCKTEPCPWGVNENLLSDKEDLDQKCPSSVLLGCKEVSSESSRGVREKSMEEERLKKEDESDCEPWFRVGDSCYRGKSPANSLMSHTDKSPYKDMIHKTSEKHTLCSECSRVSKETTRHCSRCRLLNDPIKSEITCPQQDNSTQGATETTRARKKKRKKKKENKSGMRKTKSGKVNLKNRKAKSSLHRAASTMKKKDKRKKRKLGKKLDRKTMLVKRKAGCGLLPAEPSFQLVCSSLDDLRVLINKTEDELDELDSGKKRSGRMQHKRATVKELHITLIRLLNELLPWEPKLVKAFQRNRARLKKECDDFKKHPEYENFIREQVDTVDIVSVLSTDTIRELEDSEVKINRSMKEDSEASENVNQIGNHKVKCQDDRPEIVMVSNESGHFTRASKRRQSGAINEESSPCKRGKMDSESSLTSELNVEVVSSKQNTVMTSPQTSQRASVLSTPVSSFQGTYKPIQALLAKSVGNKVTLISHPKAAVMAQMLHNKTVSASVPPVRPSTTCPPTPHSDTVSIVTPTSTTESTGQLVYKTAGGLGLLRKGSTSVKFSVQPILDQNSGEKVMQQVVILPSNLLIQSTEKKAAQESPEVTSSSIPKTTTYLSNASGFTVPENKVSVQQMAPLKDTSDVRTPSAAILPSLRTLQTTTGGFTVPKKTTEPKVTLNKSFTPTSSSPTKPDSKQELRTVCIRDSQSILVTTRGGNTGVVKVQTSEQSGTGALQSSPVFALSPQLQAFLVSKSYTSTPQAAPGTLSPKTLPDITPLINRGSPQSFSKDIIPVSSSALVTGTLASSTLNQTFSVAGGLATGKSPHLAARKSSDSVLVTVKDVPGVQQNTVSKCIMKPPQKRTLPGSSTPDQSSLQKVFLVTPSTNVPSAAAKFASTTATCTMPGSRVMFINRPTASDNSALTIPKGLTTSEANISSATSTPALEALNVIPKLGTTFGCTASGGMANVQSISVPGLTSRIFSTNKNIPEASTKTTPVIVSKVLAMSTSSGLQIGQKNNVVASSCPSGNCESPLKATGSVDGRTFTFSTLGTGHMASSALLSVVKQDVSSSVSTTFSVLNALNSKPGFTIGNSSSNISASFSGSLISKHTTLTNEVMPQSNKPQIISPLCLSPSPIKTTAIASTSGVSHPITMSSTVQPQTGRISSTPVVMSSGVRPPAPETKSVQGKIVINTTAPLAPGTQLLINNTRFVVPAQGLGPGCHVLLISNSSPGGLQGSSPASSVPRSPNCSAPASSVPRSPNCSVPSPVPSEIRLVAPQKTLVRLPSPTSTNVWHSDGVCRQVIRTPLTASGPTALQTLRSDVSSGQPGLSNIVRLPIFQTSEGKGLLVAPSQSMTSCPKETSVVCTLAQGGLHSTTSPMLLQARLANTPPQNQVAPAVQPLKTVVSRNSPIVTVPPMSSTISRMQKLPVATVPPIGSPATPIATVPPSLNTVILTSCQPIRAVQPGTIGKPVILPQPLQGQSKSPVQVPTSVLTTYTPSKLLLSPDGAILNIVRASAPSSLKEMSKPMTTQVVVPTTTSVTAPFLNTNDLLRQPDIPGGLIH
ncbi:uncharacterized protein KIAA2026-like [Myxocyprinus asiaticus]|uniref:uncharacterized protein KIAA2026-like n=1 Tax=Myxocyprinus asiaticus TaxID=70543 RepID=UPI002221FCFC|nr:uncharacterized protein KIAA2026-like [Myxocyprinus asiaticus]